MTEKSSMNLSAPPKSSTDLAGCGGEEDGDQKLGATVSDGAVSLGPAGSLPPQFADDDTEALIDGIDKMLMVSPHMEAEDAKKVGATKSSAAAQLSGQALTGPTKANLSGEPDDPDDMLKK